MLPRYELMGFRKTVAAKWLHTYAGLISGADGGGWDDLSDVERAGYLEHAKDLESTLRNSGCERCGGSEMCDEYTASYARWLAHRAEALARFANPTDYPYLISRVAIHAWDCCHFAGKLPFGPEETICEYVRSLFDTHYGEPEPPDSYLRRLTVGEATEWIAERTGPKGGRARRCRTCQPVLPGVTDSEA